MTDDLERRLRARLSGTTLPSAPDSLHEALDRLPDEAGPIGTGGRGLRLTWAMPVLVVIVVLALIAAWLPGGILGPAGPTTSPQGSSSPVPSSTPSASAAASLPVDLAGTFPGGGLWAVEGSTLLLSTDAGSSWRRTTIPTSTGVIPTVFVLDSEHVWSVTIGPGSTDNSGSSTDVTNLVVHRTVDGGQTWQASTIPANFANTSPELVFGDALHGYLVGSAQRQSDGTSTVVRTDDGGATWSDVATRPWLGAMVTASDASTVWAAGGQQEAGGQFLQPILDVSRDGGRTWQDARLPGLAGDDEAQCGCYLAGPPLFLDSGTGYVTVVSGGASGNEVTRIDRTADGGRTWTVATDQPVAADGGVAVLDPLHWLLLLDGYPAAVIGTADGGASWQTVAVGGSPSDQFTWIAGVDTHHAAALQFLGAGSYPPVSALYLSADGGSTWQPAAFSSAATSTEPPPTPAPSTSEKTVTVPLGGTHQVVVSIEDQSGLLTGARPLVLPAGTQIPASYGDLNIVAWNPGGRPATEVWLYWGGVTCDVTSGLVIGPGATSMTVTDGPRPACDASNDGRGLVLTFRQAVDANSIVVTLVPAGPSPAPQANVQAAGLLDASHGWAWTDQKLVVTSDGGSSWHDITPPGGFGGSTGDPQGVTFTDPQNGWVAINESFTTPSDPGYGRIMIWRTTDGGARWAKTELPKAVLNPFGEILPQVQFDFLDATHGFAFLSGNLAKGKNDSDLFYTADGGQTWSADRPTGTGSVGIEGNVAFATANDGVVVNADVGSGIAVTHDGGRTWADAVFAMPSGSAGAQLFFGQPVFADGRIGVVAVDFQSDSGSVTHVYRTTDAGSSWTDVEAFPASFSWVSVLDQLDWVAISDTAVRHTDDGGATWTQTGAAPPTSHAAGPQFVDDMNGWWPAGDYLDAPLYATTDGGATWHALAP